MVESRRDADSDQFNKVFWSALNNREDVSVTFYADFGYGQDIADAMLLADDAMKARMRPHMEKGGEISRLFRLDEEAAPFRIKARALLESGQVAAVDGTDALAAVEFLTTTRYACAVGWNTSQEGSKTDIHITETISHYRSPEDVRSWSSDEKINEITRQADAAREFGSWTTTFREYVERETALTKCPADIVFLDGPVVTQNLVTQKDGRELLDRMGRSKKLFIGIIKDISGSYSRCRLGAYSLNPGEGWIVCRLSFPIMDRYKGIDSWLGDSIAGNYVRVVFMPGEKAFAFECHREHVGLACALIIENSSPTINHELPLLLEMIDSKLRPAFHSSHNRDIMLSRMMQHESNGLSGYRSAINAICERDFR